MLTMERKGVGVLPFLAMIAVECSDVGVSTLSKAAMAKGMSNIVSVVYYNALGSLILLPFAFPRKNRAPLTPKLLLKFFGLGLIGSSGQMLYLTGVKYSSPTLSSAMANLIPIFTFLLAVIFRMEKFDLGRHSSQAKSLGTILSVLGASIVTLYKGPPLLGASLPSDLSREHILFSSNSRWILGGFLLALVCLSSAVWNISQAAVIKEYPEQMTVVFFYTLAITIQSAIFSFFMETDMNAWKLSSSIEIITIIYTAIFGSIFRISVHTWCLHKKGPVYVAMFRPMGIAIAVFTTVGFLHETLHLGSVIGCVVIVLGFYILMWGKVKETETEPVDEDGVSSSEPACDTTPLLRDSSGKVSEGIEEGPL